MREACTKGNVSTYHTSHRFLFRCWIDRLAAKPIRGGMNPSADVESQRKHVLFDPMSLLFFFGASGVQGRGMPCTSHPQPRPSHTPYPALRLRALSYSPSTHHSASRDSIIALRVRRCSPILPSYAPLVVKIKVSIHSYLFEGIAGTSVILALCGRGC